MQYKKSKPVGTEKILKIENGKSSVEEHRLKGAKEEIEFFLRISFLIQCVRTKISPFSSLIAQN